MTIIDKIDWEIFSNFYELRIEFLEWICNKYRPYKIKEYFYKFDISLYIWYLFLYCITLQLGWLPWILRLVVIGFYVVHESRSVYTEKRLQLRHAMLIAKDEDVNKLRMELFKRDDKLQIKSNGIKKCDPVISVEYLLNQIIGKSWSFIETWTRNLISKIEEDIQKSLSETLVLGIPGLNAKQLVGIAIETVTFGSSKPTIASVQFSEVNDRIAIDLEIEFIGGDDCEVNITAKDCFIAGIKSIQFSGLLRLELGPFIAQPPFMEILSIYFMTIPSLDFFTKGLVKADLLRNLILSSVNESIKTYVVSPNNIMCPLIPPASLKCPEPYGVILLRVVGADNLKNTDVIGKSDPYCIVSLGGWQTKTEIIIDDLNPRWNFTIMILIRSDPLLGGQVVNFTVKDYDQMDTDDIVLRSQLNVRKIYDSKNLFNQTLYNEEINCQGNLRINAAWLDISKKASDINQVEEFVKQHQMRSTKKKNEKHNTEVFTSLLMVWLVGVNDLQSSDMEVYAKLKVNGQGNETISSPKDPQKNIWYWMHNFTYKLIHPEREYLQINVFEKGKTLPFGEARIPLGEVLLQDNLEIQEATYNLITSAGSTASVTLGLKIRVVDLNLCSEELNAYFGVKERLTLQTRRKRRSTRNELTTDTDISTPKSSCERKDKNNYLAKSLNHLPGYVSRSISNASSIRSLPADIEDISNVTIDDFDSVPTHYHSKIKTPSGVSKKKKNRLNIFKIFKFKGKAKKHKKDQNGTINSI